MKKNERKTEQYVREILYKYKKSYKESHNIDVDIEEQSSNDMVITKLLHGASKRADGIGLCQIKKPVDYVHLMEQSFVHN